jgi:hypothetical protein
VVLLEPLLSLVDGLELLLDALEAVLEVPHLIDENAQQALDVCAAALGIVRRRRSSRRE